LAYRVADAGIAVVTGATRGLGKETARQLGRLGLRVFLGARDPDRGARAAAELREIGCAAHALPMDVTVPHSVAAAAETVRARHGRLDVLINNAGLIVEAPATGTDAAVLRAVYETNVFGAAEVTCRFLPLLIESPAARIVNVASTTASLELTAAGTDFGGDAAVRAAYSSSKAALNMLTVQLAAELAADPATRHIKVNSAAPGYSATALNGYQGTRTVEQGARVIVALATLPDDGPTGGFFRDSGPLPW
jgi:NAD(P)-dependent dehydrogenase (short-subunit alcohol dehydrogenase family)